MADSMQINLITACATLADDFDAIFPTETGYYLPNTVNPVIVPFFEDYYTITNGVAKKLAYDDILTCGKNIYIKTGEKGPTRTHLITTENKVTVVRDVTKVRLNNMCSFTQVLAFNQVASLRKSPHVNKHLVELIVDLLALFIHSRSSYSTTDVLLNVDYKTMFKMVKGLLLCKIYGMDPSNWSNIGLTEAVDSTNRVNLSITQFGYDMLMDERNLDQLTTRITVFLTPEFSKIPFNKILDWMLYEISSCGYMFVLEPIEDHDTFTQRLENEELNEIAQSLDYIEIKAFLERREDDLLTKINKVRTKQGLPLVTKNELL
jgi:hypothetical protein